MCRWLIYSGNELDIKNLLWIPSNSIFKQTFKKTYTPNIQNPRDHEINVDGFGVSWYYKGKLFVYKNNIPPWNDYNILNLSEFIKSRLIFAHIRAIKPFSINSVVNYQNCHPFKYLNYCWMHNGEIKYLLKLQKYIYNNCKEKIIKLIKGNTDSEYMFYIFLSQLPENYNSSKYLSTSILKESFIKTLKILNNLNDNQASSLNIAMTNGKTILCSRFINSQKESPPSLYYNIKTNESKENKKNTNQILNSETNIEKRNIIISSEPINNQILEWKLIPKNHILIYDSRRNLKIKKIKI